jgi:hypothetical protein
MSDYDRETIRHAPDPQAVKDVATLPPLPKPTRYGKWIVWSNAILSDISISDCNDTVDGICLDEHTLTSCLDKCQTPNCGAGIFIEFASGKTLCAPLNTGRHPDLNPIFRLQPQEYYKLDPALVKTSVFVNSELFPFPPNMANTVFYGDVIGLYTADKTKSLDTKELLDGNQKACILKQGDNGRLVLHPVLRFSNQIMHDLPLRYGQPFYLSVLATSYVSIGTKNDVVWDQGLGLFTSINDQLFFSLEPPAHKKDGDLVSYSDNFRIVHANRAMVYNSNNRNTTSLHLRSITQQEDSHTNEQYTFVSHMVGYTCQDGHCTTVDIHKITPKDRIQGSGDNLAGSYKGQNVYRHKGCWSLCPLSLQQKLHSSSLHSEIAEQSTNSRQSLSTALVVLAGVAGLLICVSVWVYLFRYQNPKS